MATITDFEGWLDQADPDDFEEIYALYMATLNVEEFGMYECKASPDNTKWFIKGNHTDDTLMLASDTARQAFLRLIHTKYCDPEMDMESWYHYERNMAKDD